MSALYPNIIFFANTEWYLYNFRLALLRAAGDAGYSVKCISPPGPFGEKLREAGFEWDALPFKRDSRLGMLLSLWRSRGALRRLIAATRPAIAHSFTLTSILITWLAVGAGLWFDGFKKMRRVVVSKGRIDKATKRRA